MYAVIRTGSKQYRVEPGIELLVEKLDAKEGDTVELKDVLAYGDGTSFEVGKPTLAATVSCTCLAQERGPKLMTYKYRRRENYRRRYGHRQDYTRLLVNSIKKG